MLFRAAKKERSPRSPLNALLLAPSAPSPPNKKKKQGTYVIDDGEGPIIAPCPAEKYCPGGTQQTPVSCPAGTGTFGATGAAAASQCEPQDPCVPDPNTCCRGPATQPGWPAFGPYSCFGVGGLCTNTQVDRENCGSCGSSCGTSVRAACCSGGCVDTGSSSSNCGACGVVCEGGSVCLNANCACAAGTTLSADGQSCLVPPGKTVKPDGTVDDCPSDSW